MYYITHYTKVTSIYLQYELVAELFVDKVSTAVAQKPKAVRGVMVRAAKEQPKSSKSHKKTVGSQVW